MKTETIAGYSFGIAEPNELDEVRRFHHDAFLAKGYISKPSASGMIEDARVGLSIYFYCRDSQENIVGVIRQINGSPFGLPTISDFTLDQDKKVMVEQIIWPKMVEIGSLAVPMKNHRISECLYRQIWQHSKRMLHSHWVASIDSHLLKSLRSSRGFLWEDLGNEMLYMGSKTTPVIADLREQACNMRRLAPRFLEYIDGPKPDHLYYSK